MIGTVVSVTTAPAGVEVASDAAAGTLSLAVVTALDLAETGGRVTLDGVALDYVAADHGAGTVTLAAPLSSLVPAGTFLPVDPPAPETVAVVEVAADEDDDPVLVDAVVPTHLVPSLPDGVRDGSHPETVIVDVVDGTLTVIGLPDRGPLEVWGDPDGPHTEMSMDGLRVYAQGPNGVLYPLVSATTETVAFRVAGPDGSVLGGIGSDGSITGTRATFTKDLIVGGLPLMGQVGGGLVPGRMDILPRGVVPGSQARRTTPSAQRAVGSHHPFLQSRATLHPGRLYQLVGTGVATSGAVNGVVRWTARWTTDGTTPDTSSPEITNVTSGQAYSPTVNFAQNLISDLFTVNVKTQARFVMTYQSLNGATPTAMSARCFIEDKGPVSTEALLTDGDAPTLYVTEWKASASRVYGRDGTAKNLDGQIQTWYWTPDNIRDNSAILFGSGADIADNASELGKTMPTALSGATILKSEVYLHSKIVYTEGYQPGPTALGTLGATTLPASKTIDGSLYVPEVPSGGGVWVEVPTSWFASGANLGITVGDKDAVIATPGGAVFIASMIFHGINDANPPRVRHTYTR